MENNMVVQKNNMAVPQKKKKNRSTIQSSNYTSEYILKGNENRILTKFTHFHVYHSIIHNNNILLLLNNKGYYKTPKVING